MAGPNFGEQVISQPGDSYASAKIQAVQVHPARRRLLALLQGCLLFERKNQAQPLHCRRQRRRNIPRAPIIFITTRAGFPSAQMHWMHNYGGMHSWTSVIRGTTSAQSPTTTAICGKTPLVTACQQYFSFVNVNSGWSNEKIFLTNMNNSKFSRNS